MESTERKREIKKAIARAECFWGIICGGNVTRGLGAKIMEKVNFDKLTDAEKLTLVKISTLLVKGANDIEKEFAKAEDEENQDQIDIDGEAQAETNEESQAEETRQEAESQVEPVEAEVIDPDEATA